MLQPQRINWQSAPRMSDYAAYTPSDIIDIRFDEPRPDTFQQPIVRPNFITPHVIKTPLGKRVIDDVWSDLLPIPGISPRDEVLAEGTCMPAKRVADKDLDQWNYDALMHVKIGLCVHSRIEIDATNSLFRAFKGVVTGKDPLELYRVPGSNGNGWFSNDRAALRAIVACLNAACDWCDMNSLVRTSNRFICWKCAEGVYQINSEGTCANCARDYPGSDMPRDLDYCTSCKLPARKLCCAKDKRGVVGFVCRRCSVLTKHWTSEPGNRHVREVTEFGGDILDKYDLTDLPLEPLAVDVTPQ